MLEEVDDDGEFCGCFFEHGDAVDEFHDEVEVVGFEEGALFDNFFYSADGGVVDLVCDFVFDFGLVEEALAFGAVFFDMLESPDVFGFWVLDEVDDGGGTASYFGHDTVSFDHIACFECREFVGHGVWCSGACLSGRLLGFSVCLFFALNRGTLGLYEVVRPRDGLIAP